MGIAAEIAVDLLGTTKGTLGVDDPALRIESLASFASGAPGEIIDEDAARLQLFDAGEKFAAKECAKDVHGKKKIERR